MFLPLSSCHSFFFSPPHSPTYKKTTVMTKNHSKFSITLITLITFFKNLNHRKKRNHSNHRNRVIGLTVLPALQNRLFFSEKMSLFAGNSGLFWLFLGFFRHFHGSFKSSKSEKPLKNRFRRLKLVGECPSKLIFYDGMFT